MKQLIEFIPLILFFLAYKFYGVRDAAVVLVTTTMLQIIILKLKYGIIEKQQKIMASAVVFFGILTAYFNDPIYLQWKVTIVNGLFALILFIAQFQFKTPLIKRLLQKEIQLPEEIWNRLNIGWIIFFLICMLTNIYISQYLSEEVWFTFKAFGLLGMTFVATIISGIYIYRYLPKENHSNEGEK